MPGNSVVLTAKLPEPTAKHQTEFSFEGRFEAHDVIWHCRLATLASIARLSQQSRQRQFIEIHEPVEVIADDKPTLTIMVGLNVTEIDATVIEKTTIMIRNYRRLHSGRHEYGETFEFALES